jgi:dTDP-4-dehydrorhamnose reductase
MTWLIVGASGQLGRAIVGSLITNGEKVETLNRGDIDLNDVQQVREYFKHINPSTVMNAAAWTNVDSAEDNAESVIQINAVVPGILAREAQLVEAQFIQISTDYVFSGNSSIPWSENSPVSPSCVYGQSKAEGERAVTLAALRNSYIVRTAWLYSPWRRNFVKTMVQRAMEDDSLVSVVDDQIGQPTSAFDVAEQIQLLVRAKPQYGIYHATNSGHASWFNFAQEIFRCAGVDPSRVKAIKSLDYPRPAHRPPYSVLSHQRWTEQGIDAMRDWRDALHAGFPDILQSMGRED